jgi:hypothetical protein
MAGLQNQIKVSTGSTTASKSTIYGKPFEDELRTYTMNLLKKIQDRFDIPLGDLMNVLSDGLCNHVSTCKKTGKTCNCVRAAVTGGMYCRQHTRILDTAIELEYVEIQEKPYLFDPVSKCVYSYGKKTPRALGFLSDDLQQIIL